MARIHFHGPPAIALLFALSSHSFAQFGAQVELSPDPAKEVHWLDNDADGDRDLIVLVESGGRCRMDWIENLGGGSFGPQRVIGDLASGTVDQIADLEGDGDLDVLSVTGASRGWHVNDGTGQFGAPLPLPSTTSYFGAVGADLDGDGDLEFVVADFLRDELQWHENLGGTAFGPPRVAGGTAFLPRSVYAADFNGDGLDDIAVTGKWMFGGTFDYGSVYLNTGSGALVPASIALPGSTLDEFYSYGFADINGDGLADATPLLLFLGGHAWALNTGSGFTAPMLMPGGASVLLDIDADGDLDAVQLTDGTPSSARYYAFENGGFASQATALTRATDDAIFSYRAAFDADEDGDDDLIYTLQPSAMGPGGVLLEENRFTGSIGADLCGPGEPNSTGARATLLASGSILRSANDVALAVSDLPTSSIGVVLSSTTDGSSPAHLGSQGTLCLGGPSANSFGFGSIIQGSTTGGATTALDLGAVPSTNGPVSIAAGETWLFQVWYRDANPAATTNFSSAVAIQFL